MALWLDKHRPKTLDKLTLHPGMTERLRKIASSPQFPHLLFYGPPGAGKRTRIIALLREMFGPSVERLKVEHREFKLGGTTKAVELTVVTSNHHIELNPSDAGTKDCGVVQEVIKEIASSHAITASPTRSFKVVVLNEVDRLSNRAQAALRRTMEKYSAGCRLILSCSSASKVIEPVRSRCLLLRFPAPSEADVCGVLSRAALAERVPLPDEFAQRVAEASDRNVRRALLMLEASKVQAGTAGLQAEQQVARADWQDFIAQIAKDILEEQTPRRLQQLRAKFYELLTNCIPAETIIKELAKELLSKTDATLKANVTHWAAHYEHRIRQVGLYPIVTFQYSSTTLYQVSYHIRYLFF